MTKFKRHSTGFCAQNPDQTNSTILLTSQLVRLWRIALLTPSNLCSSSNTSLKEDMSVGWPQNQPALSLTLTWSEPPGTLDRRAPVTPKFPVKGHNVNKGIKSTDPKRSSSVLYCLSFYSLLICSQLTCKAKCEQTASWTSHNEA